MVEVITDKFGPNGAMLASPTGTAASNIHGETLHSLFRVKQNLNDYRPLKRSELTGLRERYKDAKFLITYEVSMLLAEMLYYIDRRCKRYFPEEKIQVSQEFTFIFSEISRNFLRSVEPLCAKNKRVRYQRVP